MKKVTMFIGLNDQNTKKQEISTIEAYKMVQNVCAEAFGGSTIFEGKGTYTHENGEMVFENTLICIVYTEDLEGVKKAAVTIKTVLNQESIAIEAIESNSFFF